jgi:hypothetical protein
MGKIMDRLIEVAYEAEPDGPVSLILPPKTWSGLRAEVEARKMLLYQAPAQPTTFMGMSVEIDPSVPDDEIHLRHPPSPRERRGRVDVLKLASASGPHKRN